MSLFGNTQQKPPTLSLFPPAAHSQPQQSSSLFGAPQQPQQSSGLFGALLGATQPQQQASGSIFGAAPQQQSSSFFNTAPQQGQQGTSSFYQSTAPAQQQPGQLSLKDSFFAASQAGAPRLSRLGESQWQPAPNPREKPIQTQMEEIYMKWHPQAPQCVFQHYFYQNVGAERVPYFGVPEGEDPRKWEEALKDKPSDGSIPVLARGFGQEGIAGRITIQDAAVKALYDRVHEMDNSLRTRIEQHDLQFTIRTQEARRKHIALSRRCLALATKVQVLRNRGYALDGAEEELKAKLEKLEKATFDPVLNGRQEELWARMTIVRERASILKDEMERLGKQAGNAEQAPIDEDTMNKIKQILSSYDSQLAHLRKEIDMIKIDFEEWDASTRPVAASLSQR